MRRSTTDNSLSLEIPDDWEIWEGDADDLLVAAAPEEDADGIQPQLLVTREQLDYDTDSKGYMVGNLVYSQACLPGYEEHGSGEFAVGEQGIAWTEYTSDAGGFRLTAVSYYIVRGGDAFLLQYKANPAMFPRWRDSFDRMVRSIRFV